MGLLPIGLPAWEQLVFGNRTYVTASRREDLMPLGVKRKLPVHIFSCTVRLPSRKETFRLAIPSPTTN